VVDDPSPWVTGDGVRGRLCGDVVFFARSPRMRDLSYFSVSGDAR